MKQILIFFKERRKRILMEQLYTLKEQMAFELKKSETSKNAANQLQLFIDTRQQCAKHNYEDRLFLSANIELYLKEIDKYETNSVISKQRYENLLNEISLIEKELSRIS